MKLFLALWLGLSSAGLASAQTFKETATCKLTNVAAGKSLYEGPCRVKQSMEDGITLFTIRMGNAEPFLFAGRRGQSTWMHGPEKVQFTDLPNGGIFRWSNFALVVAEEGSADAAGSGQNLKETATCKLSNVTASKSLYEGPCKVKQSSDGDLTMFTVKMGKTEPFLFAGRRGQKTWMHGPEEVQFTDLPNGGIFRWSNFALVVRE